MKNDSFNVIICRVGLQGKRKKNENDPQVLGHHSLGIRIPRELGCRVHTHGLGTSLTARY